MVCPLSLYYIQYKFWFLRNGLPFILFDLLKNGSFLIRSTILCTGSLNATFTSPIYVSGSYTLKSFRGLRGKTLCRERFSNGALPLLCSRSFLRRLYSSICLMSCLISCLISLGGLLVNDSRSSESSSNPYPKSACRNLLITSANFIVKLPILTDITASIGRRPSSS